MQVKLGMGSLVVKFFFGKLRKNLKMWDKFGRHCSKFGFLNVSVSQTEFLTNIYKNRLKHETFNGQSYQSAFKVNFKKNPGIFVIDVIRRPKKVQSLFSPVKVCF
jgi:hypothetical protein